jgi:hypothetical protein
LCSCVTEHDLAHPIHPRHLPFHARH